MSSTKLVAHEYVCIRALEAVLAQIRDFTPEKMYRVSAINIRKLPQNRRMRMSGKVLKFSTVKETDGKFEIGFSCTIQLYMVLGLWEPQSFEIVLEEIMYKGTFAASATYNILIIGPIIKE